MTDSFVVRKTAVLGAGAMGRGIAIAALQAGCDVALFDVSTPALDQAQRRVDDHFRRHPPAAAAPRPGQLTVAATVDDAIAAADAVIEAVPELPDVKKDLFQRLAGLPETVLLASNTSTISIAALAAACGDSPRVVGMHFFNPAHRMPLVEVIVAPSTSERARDDAVALARAWGKEPVVVRDRPGFITSRLGLIVGTEAMRMVEEGVASAAGIDTAMRLGYRHPMGPLELADLVGLDARLNNLRSLHAQSGNPAYAPPAILEDLVRRGRLGRKTGHGFFDYDDTGRIVDSAGPADRPQ